MASERCPFVECDYVFFDDNLITMAHRGLRNLVVHILNSPWILSQNATPSSNGLVCAPHVARVQCRVSGSTAGRAVMRVRGHNKLNGLAEVSSATVNGAAGTGTWTDLSVTFTHVPHQNPKLPDPLNFLLMFDHNGLGNAEWRNVTVEVPPQ